MPRVYIPSMLRKFSDGLSEVDVEGKRIDEVIENLESRFPGIRACLCNGDQIRLELNVSVDNKISALGMVQPVKEQSEIHFIPAIGGG
jgi:sulfur-carrier protein